MTSMMHNLMKETCINSMSTENADDDDGSYEPFAAIHREEGKDESAFEATENHVAECFSRHAAGQPSALHHGKLMSTHKLKGLGLQPFVHCQSSCDFERTWLATGGMRSPSSPRPLT